MTAHAFSIDVHAKRRDCACCPAFIYLQIHPSGQSTLASDDVIDRALWTYRWAKVNGLTLCPSCIESRPHLDDDIEEEREAGMAIRVVASGNSDTWRKR